MVYDNSSARKIHALLALISVSNGLEQVIKARS
jgi:hypothetical protein